MPQKSFPYQFGQPRRVEAIRPLTEEQIAVHLASGPEAATINVVLGRVDAGYLFHIERSGGTYTLRSYSGEALTSFEDIESLTRFLNHASGLEFDEDSWRRSEELNRRIEVRPPEGADAPSDSKG